METQDGGDQTNVAEQEVSGADSALPQNNEAAGQEAGATENKGLTIEDLAKRFSSDAAQAKKPKPAAPKADEAQSDTEDTAESEDQSAPKETQAQDSPTEAQPEDDLSQFSESVRKKIGKYTFKLKQAEHELTQVKAKAQEAEQLRAHLAHMQQELARVTSQQQASSADTGDVDTAVDEAALAKHESRATEAIRFYERNRRLIDRAAIQGEESVVIDGTTYPISELENGYDYAKRMKEERVPERRKAVQASQAVKQQSMTFAQQVVPAMFQPGTPESNLAVGYLQSNPKLRDFDDSPRLLALAIKGFQVLQKEAEAAKAKVTTDAGTQKPKPAERAPNLDGGGIAPTRSSREDNSTAAKKQAAAAMDRLRKSGSTSDLAEYFKNASR